MRFKNKSKKAVGLLLTILMVLTIALPVTAADTDIPPSCDGTVKTQSGDPVVSGTLVVLVGGEVRNNLKIINGLFGSVIDGEKAADDGKAITFKVKISGTEYDPISVVEEEDQDLTWTLENVYLLTITVPMVR